jgi:hypothetical protein
MQDAPWLRPAIKDLPPKYAREAVLIPDTTCSRSSFLNRFAHRSPTVDEAVLLVSANTLLKGGVVVASIWWIWFQQEDNQEKRESVLVALVAGFLGLAMSRILSRTIDRARPLNEPQLSFQLPYGSVPAGFEGRVHSPAIMRCCSLLWQPACFLRCGDWNLWR